MPNRVSTDNSCDTMTAKVRLVMAISYSPMNIRNNRIRHSGFTLIEVAASLLAFSVVVIIFASSIVMAEKTAHVNGQYAQAISLCQHKIDQARAVGFGRLNYTELNDAGIIDDSPISSPYSFAVVDEVANYLPQPTATLTLQPDPSDPDKVIKVSATVTWRAAAHQTKTSSLTLVGLVANVE
ncbi:MAG: type IV pilus modification PilV family protein [Armatimonadota bacterium]